MIYDANIDNARIYKNHTCILYHILYLRTTNHAYASHRGDSGDEALTTPKLYPTTNIFQTNFGHEAIA